MGALTQAMASAAQATGAEIRSGAEVIEIRVKDGAASGVILSTGEEIDAGAVISNADPKRTLLSLVGPEHLGPLLLMRLKNYRLNGTAAKMNLALDALPKFTALQPGSQTIQDLALMASMVRRHRGALPPITVTRRSHKAYLRSTSLLVTDVRPDVQQKSKAMQQSLGLEEAAMDVRSARPASAWDSFIASSTIA